MAPDGRFVGGGNNGMQAPVMTPNGGFVSGGSGTTMCPNGQFVAGSRCVMNPDGSFSGR